MKLLFTTLLFPPGIYLVLIGLALFFLMRKRPKRAGTLLLVALVVGWVFSTQSFGRFLSLALVSNINGPQLADPAQTDMIVALTGGIYNAGQQIGWLPETETYRRVAVAYAVQNGIGSRIPVLISGGHTAGLQNPAEATVVADYFKRNSAQLTPTLTETASTDTYESSLQVAAIAGKREAQVLVLVTSELHMPRALAVYRARGINAVPFPVIVLPRGSLGIKGYLPTWKGVRLTSHALYEYFGILSYWLSGKFTWQDFKYN